MAIQNKPKAKTREKEVRREAPVRTGDNVQSAPTSNPRRQETANEGEQLNDLTVEQLLCSLERSEDETEVRIAALLSNCAKVRDRGRGINKAYSDHRVTLEEYISAGQHADTKGKKTPNYKRVTQIRQIRKKTLRGKTKEKAERYRSLQQKWKVSRKSAVKQVLDGASDAKCQIDPKVIEETYAERFEGVGPTVDLSNYPGAFTEPPLPPSTPEKSGNVTPNHPNPNSQTRQAEPSCERILDVVNASEVRKAVRAMRTGSAAGKDRIRVLKVKRKAEEGPGFLAGVYTMWLMTGKVPKKLKASKSLLLPKGTRPWQH